MRRKEFKRKPLAEWVAYSLAAATVVGSTLVYAGTPAAGTQIKNLATVTYEDESGNKYSAQSNEAIITVAAQFKSEIGVDNTVVAAAGQTVYFPHTVTNTGNETDTYTVGASDGTTAYTVYLDSNGNGQPDAGELEINASNKLSLNAGELANLVVAYPVPSGAASTDAARVVTLTVASDNSAAITDTTDANGGADTVQTTNTDTLTISEEAVLVNTKTAVVDESNNTITYTLNLKNVGGAAAANVVILDALPMVDHDDDVSTAKVPVTLVGAPTLNGFLGSGDSTAAQAVTDEATIGFDVDGDGLTTSQVINVVDAELPVNTTVSVVFTVSFDPSWSAGAAVENSFVAYPNPTPVDPADPSTIVDPTDPSIFPTPPNPSNKTTTEIPTSSGLTATDTGDGRDDDGTMNGTQLIDTTSAGAVLEYPIVITNTGNGEDAFNLTDGNSTFPAGSVVTYWNKDGTVQLTDTDGDGIPDTGNLTPGEIAEIIVKVDLPSGVSTTTPVTTDVTVTSSKNPTTSQDVTLQVNEILAPSVDIWFDDLGTENPAGTADYQPTTGANDAGVENAHDEGPVALSMAGPGETAVIKMKLANESGSAESYVLSMTDVPSGWTAVFKDSAGSVISATTLIPPNGEFEYTLEVTVPLDPTLALADAPAGGNNVDGYDNVNDAASVLTSVDGDNDYVLSFHATAASNSAITDEVQYAFDVAPSDNILQITPNGSQQIAPGGTVDYDHTVKNTGNTVKPFEMTATNSISGWGSVIMVDTTGDGQADTNIEHLTAGTTITVLNPDGSSATVTLTDTDTDGNIEIPLAPGQYLKVVNKVTAIAQASQGIVNTTTLSATDADGTILTSAVDNSNVVLGQVRLTKEVAVDAACDGTADGAFAEIQTTNIEPGQCAIWKLVAKNEGSAMVKNVVITDDVPEYTTIHDTANTLLYCQSVGCTPAPGAVNATETAGNVVVNVGTGATATNGGDLMPGDEATVMFSIKID